MKNSTIINFSIFTFAGIILFLSFVTGDSIDNYLLKWLSGAASTVVILWLIYEKWIWKLPVIKYVAVLWGVPVIHGTWKGILEFDKDENGQSGSLEFYVSIDQSLTKVSIKSYFSKPSESYSVIATIRKNDISGNTELLYLYRSEAPHGKRETNSPHDGTAILHINGIINPREIVGSYFTDRKGTGRIKLTPISENTSDTFEEAEKLCSSTNKQETN